MLLPLSRFSSSEYPVFCLAMLLCLKSVDDGLGITKKRRHEMMIMPEHTFAQCAMPSWFRTAAPKSSSSSPDSIMGTSPASITRPMRKSGLR